MTSYRTKEEVEKEFDGKTEASNYEKGGLGYGIKTPNDSLLDSQEYPESQFEIDPDKVKEYIHSLRLSDLESIIEGIEEMGKDKVYISVESVLSYLKSLKRV